MITLATPGLDRDSDNQITLYIDETKITAFTGPFKSFKGQIVRRLCWAGGVEIILDTPDNYDKLVSELQGRMHDYK